MRGQPGLRDLTSKVIEREKCLNSNHIVLNFLRATSVVLAGFLQVTLRNLWDQLLSSLPKSDKWLTRLPQDHSEHVSSPIGGGLGISPLVNLNFFREIFLLFIHFFVHPNWTIISLFFYCHFFFLLSEASYSHCLIQTPQYIPQKIGPTGKQYGVCSTSRHCIVAS